jgi:hypothetical protein
VTAVCFILLALLAVVQVAHLHSNESDADHCPLCVVMHSAACRWEAQPRWPNRPPYFASGNPGCLSAPLPLAARRPSAPIQLDPAAIPAFVDRLHATSLEAESSPDGRLQCKLPPDLNRGNLSLLFSHCFRSLSCRSFAAQCCAFFPL